MSPRSFPLDEPTHPSHGQMTVEDFLAFTRSRPDEERWELIEGRPVMQASPSNLILTAYPPV